MQLQKPQNYVSMLQLSLLCLLVLWLPSNLFLKLQPNSGFVHGLQIDYLIPKLYVTDLLIVGIFLLEGTKNLSSRLKALSSRKNKFQVISSKFQKFNFQTLNYITTQLPNNLLLTTCYFLLATFFLRQLSTLFPIIALWQAGKLIMFGIFIKWLLSKQSVLVAHYEESLGDERPLLATRYLRPTTYYLLLTTITFQSLLGLYQFFFQKSLTAYQLFGETQLRNQPGLARADFSWLDTLIGTDFGLRVLPYGTLPHPNVLAGFLAIGMVVIWKIGKMENGKYFSQPILLFSYFPILLTMFLTQSWSAWLTLIIGISLLELQDLSSKFRKSNFQFPTLNFQILNTKYLILATLILHFSMPLVLTQLPNYLPAVATRRTSGLQAGITTQQLSTSFLRRNYLNDAAWQMFSKNPLTGVGFHQFTAHVEAFSQNPEVVSFAQPAHHVGLLFLAENGILGVIIIGSLFWKVLNNSTTQPPYYSLLATGFLLLPILSLDHYLYTLQQGWLMMILLNITVKNFEN